MQEIINIHQDWFPVVMTPKKAVAEAWLKAIDQIKPDMKTQYVFLDRKYGKVLEDLGILKKSKRKNMVNCYILPKKIAFVSEVPDDVTGQK